MCGKEVPIGDPMRDTWERYKNTNECENARQWASFPQHVNGSLWAAFVEGYKAATMAIVDGENFCDECGVPGPIDHTTEDGHELCDACHAESIGEGHAPCDECGATNGIEGETDDGLKLCFLCFGDYLAMLEEREEIEDETVPV